MPATLTVRDETAFKFDITDEPLTLSFLTEQITVRELIRARVKQEVETYNARPSEYFVGFVQPSDTERTLNGFKLLKARRIDWEEQFDRAIRAFEQNGFLLLVDDRQVDNLDDLIYIRPDTSVTFLKLVPLVGG